jgi:hypothetical protein
MGPVMVDSGGTLAPGGAVTGVLSVSNNLVLNGGSSMFFRLGTACDRVVALGNLTVGGVLNVSGTAGFQAGTYTLFAYGGSLTWLTPTFGTMPVGYTCAFDTNMAGRVNLVVTTAVFRPTIAQVSIGSRSLCIQGSNGAAGTAYVVLEQTNLLAPLPNWWPVATNLFSADGWFSNSIPIAPEMPTAFFLIKQ